MATKVTELPVCFSSIDYTKLVLIAFGKSGIVYGIDNEMVLKEYYGEPEDIDAERRAFARLCPHPNIVNFLGNARDGSIVLERGIPLKTLLQQSNAAQLSWGRKLGWLKDAARGLIHMHKNGILQADVGCHNMIVIGDRVKLIDFEGSCIDGGQGTSGYVWFSYRASMGETSQATDIFAYGCAMYEILTGRPPYYEFDNLEDKSKIVQRLYDENKFPALAYSSLNEVLQGCWLETYKSMDEVLGALEAMNMPVTDAADTNLPESASAEPTTANLATIVVESASFEPHRQALAQPTKVQCLM